MTTPGEVDWTALFHACGAATDVPARLAALCGADEDAAGEAYSFLWPCVFAQGRFTPATAPVICHLVAVLDDRSLGAGDDTIRDGVLYLFAEVARIATGADIDALRDAAGLGDATAAWLEQHLARPRPPAIYDWNDTDEPGRALLSRAMLDCFDLLPEVFAALWPLPVHWPARTRVMAAHAATMLIRHPRLADRCGELIAFHDEAARASTDRYACASYVLGLGALGVAPRAWLQDPRLAVRTCAALAPALAGDDTAVEVLLKAAEHPRAFYHSFTEPLVPPRYRVMLPAQLQGMPHQVLIQAVCERVGDFRRLLHAALAAVDLRDGHRPGTQLGPYLCRAFPAGLTDDGTATAEQSLFAAAVAARDELWDGTRNGAREVFAAAGLPHDRERWRNVQLPEVLDAAGRPAYDSARIVVVEPRLTVRNHPQMYLGAARTDPDLLRRLLAIIREGAVSVDVEEPRRFAVTATCAGAEQPDPDEFVHQGPGGPPQFYGLRLAAALSLWVTVRWWTDGIEYRQQFVDGVPQGPRETSGPAGREDGYHIVFELDEEWLPRSARLPG